MDPSATSRIRRRSAWRNRSRFRTTGRSARVVPRTYRRTCGLAGSRCRSSSRSRARHLSRRQPILSAVDALEPRPSLQPLEDLTGVGEEWPRLFGSSLSRQPFPVLEQGRRQVEGEHHLPEQSRRALEARLDAILLSVESGEPRSEPHGVRLEKLRGPATRKGLDDREELLNFPDVVQVERRLDANPIGHRQDFVPFAHRKRRIALSKELPLPIAVPRSARE